MSTPLVSALMVTRNRGHLARLAIHCFAAQTWPHKELVIVDDGSEDYEPIIAPYRGRITVHYHRIVNDGTLLLGGLRNLSLERAGGEFLTQWDDDEWYHPRRIEAQMTALEAMRLDAVTLRWTLMHLDAPGFTGHLYRTGLRAGTPGTILQRRSVVRYENLRRGEDSIYRNRLARSCRVGVMREPHSHLFIRCYHGENTWDLAHFTERLHARPVDKLHWLRARYLARDIFTHPAFRLTALEREAAALFLEDRRARGSRPLAARP
jgi:glycosyltransferase involved in cell wall biosynthesis